MHNLIKLATGLFLCSVIITACQDDSDPTLEDTPDQELQEALNQASEGQGLDFFKMPASDDFANIPQDPQNPMTSAKVELGKLLYHETGLGLRPIRPIGEGTYSCASCHHVDAGFQANMAQGIGEGGSGFGSNGEGRQKDPLYAPIELDVQDVRSPTTLNVAFQSNMLWNGQFGATGVNIGTESAWTPGTPKEINNQGFEGVETQAIAGMGVHRLTVEDAEITQNTEYRTLFDAAFPDIPAPQRITIRNAGLAIAAYERTLLANEAPFQKWLQGENNAMSDQEKSGALLFFGKANCVSCHTGPALNSMTFHGLGLADLFEQSGVFKADVNSVGNLGRGGFTQNTADNYKFKVPQLYNLKDSPFYGHGASFQSIEAVLEYKNNAQAENSRVPSSQLAAEFIPLGLSQAELDDLKTFLETALYDANLQRYVPTQLPTNLCFPNNDTNSRSDLGCL